MSSEKRGILRTLFAPRYDETSLFVMSITFIALYIINETMRSDLYKFASAAFRERERGSTAAGFVLLAICFIGGICFSIYHAFSSREKTVGDKAVMLFFAIPVTGGTGLYAGKWMLTNTGGWLMIFPVCNVIVSGVLLIKFARMITRGRIDVSCISDRDATRGEIILGLSVAAIIVGCCQYWFHLYWAVTFSICVAYASIVNEAVQGLVMPFVALRQTGEQQFRTACRDAIADCKLTLDEKHELTALAKSLAISRQLAKQLFDDEKRIFLKNRHRK